MADHKRLEIRCPGCRNSLPYGREDFDFVVYCPSCGLAVRVGDEAGSSPTDLVDRVPEELVDPYSDWLGIHSGHPPLNHYTLLGLRNYESNTAEIRRAFVDRCSLVRPYEVGRYAERASSLMAELSEAFHCLTNEHLKTEYDQELGEARDELPVLPRAHVIAGYRILQRIGRGRVGEVYLAQHPTLRRTVALKVFPDVKPSERMISRLLREARCWARIESPHIVSIHDVGQERERFYIAMQYVEGKTLRDLVTAHGPLPMRSALRIIRSAAKGIQELHSHGLLHRNIHPSNVMLSSHSEVIVLEPGEIWLQVWGEPLVLDPRNDSFRAPEQAIDNSRPVDGRCDVYSLGALLYYLLTGTSPALSGAGKLPPPLEQVVNECPSQVSAFCGKAMALRTDHRFATVEELGKSLTKLIRDLALPELQDQAIAPSDVCPAPARSTPMASATPRADYRADRRRFNGALLAVAVVIAPCLAGLLFLLAKNLSNSFAPPVESSNPPSVSLDISGDVYVFIWANDDSPRKGLALRDPGALPLRLNDLIRIEAELNRVAYLYVLWIDTQGQVSPIYPWLSGRWSERPESEAPVKSISLPKDPDVGWPLVGGPGVETLVLLSRESRLPKQVDLQQLLSELPALPAIQDTRSVVEFEDGEMITSAKRPDSRPNSYASDDTRDPVIQMQHEIYERLRPHFTLIRTVSMANAGHD